VHDAADCSDLVAVVIVHKVASTVDTRSQAVVGIHKMCEIVAHGEVMDWSMR
jgi:hypothetical protein